MGRQYMGRQYNPFIKGYLVKLVIDRLKKCQLFVDEYGENFAQERIEQNLYGVFTNEVSNSKAGYYKPSDHSITICSSGQNGDLLRTEDLSEFEKYIILHEALHAIFNKTKEECANDCIESGTGMRSFSKSEIGRGLNEGLTEWICEKAGIEDISYLTLTGFIKQIELAIGERNVIKLARNPGSLSDSNHIVNLLHMGSMRISNTFKYLSLADQVYLSEAKERQYYYIIDIRM